VKQAEIMNNPFRTMDPALIVVVVIGSVEEEVFGGVVIGSVDVELFGVVVVVELEPS
jgi:hypothetical protein